MGSVRGGSIKGGSMKGSPRKNNTKAEKRPRFDWKNAHQDAKEGSDDEKDNG